MGKPMTQIELIEGTTRDLKLSQYFTPPELAQRVVEWACDYRGGYRKANGNPMRVLEPSAGNGALVRPLVAAGAEVTAIEIDWRYSDDLKDALKADAAWMGESFLDFKPHDHRMRPAFDLVVTNPPYEGGMDVAFILHALKFAPRVVGIFTDRILFGVERKEGLWSQVRPTRIAFQSRRPFKGAQTDYVVLELVRQDRHFGSDDLARVTVEFW
jgi:predicted RNA methylase